MRALVTDIHLRSSLAGIRALSRAGYGVGGLASGIGAAGVWSRELGARAIERRAGEDADALWAGIARLSKGRGPVAVYPGQEWTIDALLDREPPPDVVVGYPSAEGTRAVRDKRALGGMAADAGLASPQTVEAPAGELGSAALRFPCVVKPASPKGAFDARAVESAEELRTAVNGLPAEERVLVQERVRGPLMAIGMVVGHDGEVVARFQQESERTWPAQAGVSSVARSVAPDEELVARAAALLREAGYAGLAQLQFMSAAGGPALIDVNPRYYGSLALATACGVNLPAAWHAVVSGAPAPAADEYRVGVSYRWLEGELLAALYGSPGVLLRRPPPPRVPAVWAWGDPLPAFPMAFEAVASRVARRLPGRWRRG